MKLVTDPVVVYDYLRFTPDGRLIRVAPSFETTELEAIAFRGRACFSNPFSIQFENEEEETHYTWRYASMSPERFDYEDSTIKIKGVLATRYLESLTWECVADYWEYK
jgi:hypothetical protein